MVTLTKTFTSDIILIRRKTKTFTADIILERGFDYSNDYDHVNFDVGLVVQTKTFTADLITVNTPTKKSDVLKMIAEGPTPKSLI